MSTEPGQAQGGVEGHGEESLVGGPGGEGPVAGVEGGAGVWVASAVTVDSMRVGSGLSIKVHGMVAGPREVQG